MIATPPTYSDLPPLTAVDEEETSHTDEYTARCLEHLHSLEITKDWTLGTLVVTKSSRWGLVLRADFSISDIEEISGVVNRIICWTNSDQTISYVFAFGQIAPPLAAP